MRSRAVRWASPGSAGDCEHPVEVYDDVTGLNAVAVRCGATRQSKCSTCAARHRRNVARVGRSGWLDRPRDRGYFVTLTAPGEDVLPWDRNLCTHADSVACSGRLGCRCEAQALAAWHADLGQRWSWFVEYLRRALGVDVQFFKAFEAQSRGAQHAHAMFRISGVVVDRRVRAAFRLSAMRWGFGQQLKIDAVDMTDERAVARTAGYCAKYASKSADADRSVVDTATGEVLTLHLRAWSKSARWGESMKSIRQQQRLWASAAGGARQGAPVVPPGGAAALDLNSDFYTERGQSNLLVDHVGAPAGM